MTPRFLHIKRPCWRLRPASVADIFTVTSAHIFFGWIYIAWLPQHISINGYMNGFLSISRVVWHAWSARYGESPGVGTESPARWVMPHRWPSMTWVFLSGWWFGCHQFGIFPEILGCSSSQLTSSYFSEGWPNHQPAMFSSLRLDILWDGAVFFILFSGFEWLWHVWTSQNGGIQSCGDSPNDPGDSFASGDKQTAEAALGGLCAELRSGEVPRRRPIAGV